MRFVRLNENFGLAPLPAPKLTLRGQSQSQLAIYQTQPIAARPQASSERLGPAQSHIPAHCVGPPRLSP